MIAIVVEQFGKSEIILWNMDNIITDKTGCGVEVEVYENEVVIRGRNFYTGEWATDGTGLIEKTYPLKNPVTD